jgi:hypothetical protein
MQHSEADGTAEKDCYAHGAKRFDQGSVEQTLIALCDVAIAVWKRFRAEQPIHA